MTDQAQRLRELVAGFPTSSAAVLELRPELARVRTIAVTSGKGGVGKSNLVANLAISLARRGKKILVVDADLSLANIDVLMGLQPRFNLSHVLSGEKRLGEVIVEGPSGIRVIPAASGIAELSMVRESELEGLIDQFTTFLPDMDLILVDTAAGLADSVMSFVHAAEEVILVTTPEPTAYMDAYQMLKNVHLFDPNKKVHLVVNMAASEDEGDRTAVFMAQMADRFLGHELPHLGTVLRDPDVPLAIRNQTPFLEDSPHGIASRGIQRLATRLLNNKPEEAFNPDGGESMWRRVASYLRGVGQ